MDRVRAALRHIWDVTVIAVLFVVYVVGLTVATIIAKARRLVAHDSTVETEPAERA